MQIHHHLLNICWLRQCTPIICAHNINNNKNRNKYRINIVSLLWRFFFLFILGVVVDFVARNATQTEFFCFCFQRSNKRTRKARKKKKKRSTAERTRYLALFIIKYIYIKKDLPNFQNINNLPSVSQSASQSENYLFFVLFYPYLPIFTI